MIARFQEYEERLIQEVWGEQCLECDSLMTPKIRMYHLKGEEVAVMNCPVCDFTIVVVEIEKLARSQIDQRILENDNTIVATHNSHR